jgi:virginiamycin B lyase
MVEDAPEALRGKTMSLLTNAHALSVASGGSVTRFTACTAVSAVGALLCLVTASSPALAQPAPDAELVVQEYPTPAGARPHDAVPDRFGAVWYAGQGNGTVGRLDPSTGEVQVIKIADRSAPHGIIIGPDDAPWITDGGLNAIVRVDPATFEVRVFPLPGERASLNTATFDGRGVLWFTGQSGYIGRLDPTVGVVQQWAAPRGGGPYGMATAPDGTVYFASLAGSYLGRIDDDSGTVTVLDPPTPQSGVRRVWPDSAGNLWIAQYNVGQVGRYAPSTGQWREWRLPGASPRAYAVYVDQTDTVWLTDTSADTIVRFEPATETFTTVAISRPSNIAQLGGRPGEVWGAQRARDHVVVVRSGASSAAVHSEHEQRSSPAVVPY